MIIIFFGLHSKEWMNVLNNKLIPDFLKYPTITDIKNVYNVNKLTNLDLSSGSIIIPLMETHMMELHKKNIKALMPSLKHLQMFSCKKKFATYVKNNNLEQYTPKVYTSIDEITTDKLYIIKPYNLNNGTNMCIKKSIEKKDFVNKIIQEYIENKIEYVANIVSKDGYIIKCITYAYNFDDEQHIKRHPINTQNMTKIELDNKYLLQLELFFLYCGYTGISNTDFIICDGQIKVFEINPRLGGGLVRFDRTDLIEILYEMIKLNEIKNEIKCSNKTKKFYYFKNR